MHLLDIPQRRHSALRTINGGICWGLTLRLRQFTQLLLLRYQRTLNGLMFKLNLLFISLPNITCSFPCRTKTTIQTFTLLLSADLWNDFKWRI